MTSSLLGHFHNVPVGRLTIVRHFTVRTVLSGILITLPGNTFESYITRTYSSIEKSLVVFITLICDLFSCFFYCNHFFLSLEYLPLARNKRFGQRELK